jgi:hypothetical protein
MEAKALAPLKDYEEKLSYAKYYKMNPPNGQLMGELAKGPMDASKALSFKDINKLLDPGYDAVETGYCQMDEGYGYLALNFKFPKVTVPMIQWWYAWVATGGNLRYKIWDPEDHTAIAICEEDKAKILNPAIPYSEKCAGVCHSTMEMQGPQGEAPVTYTWHSGPDLGIDMEKYRTSAVKWILGASVVTDFDTQKSAASLIHTVREIDGGIEFRTRVWCGSRFVEGKPIRALPPFPPGFKIPVEAPMGIGFLLVKEFSQLAAILPDLYAEYGKKPLDAD